MYLVQQLVHLGVKVCVCTIRTSTPPVSTSDRIKLGVYSSGNSASAGKRVSIKLSLDLSLSLFLSLSVSLEPKVHFPPTRPAAGYVHCACLAHAQNSRTHWFSWLVSCKIHESPPRAALLGLAYICWGLGRGSAWCLPHERCSRKRRARDREHRCCRRCVDAALCIAEQVPSSAQKSLSGASSSLPASRPHPHLPHLPCRFFPRHQHAIFPPTANSCFTGGRG